MEGCYPLKPHRFRVFGGKMGFYSYLWLRADGSPYYAGKGSGNRAYRRQGHNVSCPIDKTRILVFPMLSEAEAFESEIALIDLFGRKDIKTGCLRNVTNGGEGVGGRKHPPDEIAKMKGRKYTPDETMRRRKRMQGVVCGLHIPQIQRQGPQASVQWRKDHPERTFAIARSGGLIGGRKNTESGHIQKVAHYRWHVNRNQPSAQCSFCTAEACDAS